MKNIISGYMTTIIGAIIMIAALLDWFGVINPPVPEGISKFEQLMYGFLAGLVLFIVPKGFLEKKAKSLLGVMGKKVK